MATFITPVSINVSSLVAATWTPFSLTGIVPAGTTGVMLIASGTATVNTYFGVRATGSTDVNIGGQTVASSPQQMLITGLRASDLSFDFYSNGVGAGLVLWLIGYFGSDATFFTNRTDFGVMTQNAYTDYDLSSVVPAGTLAAVVSINTYAVAGFRQSSTSTDDFISGTQTNGVGGAYIPYTICGLDANRKMNARCNSASIHLHIVGYITAGLVWNNSSIDRTPGTAGSFQNLTTTTGAIGYLYQENALSSVTNISVATSGVTTLPYMWGTRYCGGQLACGTPPTTKIANVTNMRLWELGYFTPVTTTYPLLLTDRGRGRFRPQRLWGRMF